MWRTANLGKIAERSSQIGESRGTVVLYTRRFTVSVLTQRYFPSFPPHLCTYVLCTHICSYSRLQSAVVTTDEAACGALCLAWSGAGECKGFTWQHSGAGSAKCTLEKLDIGETPTTYSSYGAAVLGCTSYPASTSYCTNFKHYSLKNTKQDCNLGAWSPYGATCASSCESTLSGAAAMQSRSVTLGQCGGEMCGAEELASNYHVCVVPSSPSGVSATLSLGTHVQVDWTALTSLETGFNTVKKYTITAYTCADGAATAADCKTVLWAVGTPVSAAASLSTTSIQVTNGGLLNQLTPGRAFSFGVTAENDGVCSTLARTALHTHTLSLFSLSRSWFFLSLSLSLSLSPSLSRSCRDIVAP